MLRRVTRHPRAGVTLSRGFLSTGVSGLGREAVEQYEQELREAEEKVNSRKVLFAAGSSTDHRPRVAAAEAFDLACAALPRPPNFAFVVISLDNSTMSDAPEAMWRSLAKSSPTPPVMLGTLVKYQRPGNGHVQVLAGTIPDLVMDRFTLDVVPSAEELLDSAKPAPFMAVSFLDPALAIQHEGLINTHLETLRSRLGGAPVVGSICAPLTKPDGTSAGSTFFFNDNIFTGSAAAAVLRSNLVKCNVAPVVPSISVASGVVTAVETSADGAITITSINDRPVLEVIKSVYEQHLADRKRSKVYLGIKRGDSVFPVTFRGDRDRQVATATLPVGVALSRGETVHFVVDDDEMDAEAAAAMLLHSRGNIGERLSCIEKNITVQREARKYVVCSSCSGLHFSHPGMNQVAQRNNVIDFSEGATLYAPSIIQRCIGNEVPSTGVFTPGQVVTLGTKPAEQACYVGSRSSVFAILEGKE